LDKSGFTGLGDRTQNLDLPRVEADPFPPEAWGLEWTQAPKELDGQVWDDAGWMLSGLSGF
jgi:hypothetical protein